MLAKSLGLSLILVVTAAAKPMPRMVQSHYNAQLVTQDARDVTERLESLCRECDAQISNLNSDQTNGNGNLNLRLPEDKLNRFSQGLRKVGSIRSENRSSSDNTNSYLETQRNLAMAEKTMSAQWTVSGTSLTATERGLVDAEFKSYLRDRINSYRSTLSSYEQNQGMAEVSINWSAPPNNPQPAPPEQVQQLSTMGPTRVEVIEAPVESPWKASLLGPAAVMLMLIGYFLVRRRAEPCLNSDEGSKRSENRGDG